MNIDVYICMCVSNEIKKIEIDISKSIHNNYQDITYIT